MAETANITKMAEKLSEELFSSFGWQLTGTTNFNWPCCKSKEHRVSTHPTDVVWYYDEPYETVRTYINADLKSYAKTSITPNSISSALLSLAKAIDCVEESQEWKNIYLRGDSSYKVHGLLFVYNHDGAYDAEFISYLKQLRHSDLKLPCKRVITVMGPKEICELAAISSNIRQLGFSWNKRQPIEHSFFYPELKRKRYKRREGLWANAATINILTSKLIVVKVRNVGSQSDYEELHVYYRGSGQTRDEFLHLIDYLFCYQQLGTAHKITIHFVSLTANEVACANFVRARDEYDEVYTPGIGVLDKLRFESLTEIVTKFSSVELGMRG